MNNELAICVVSAGAGLGGGEFNCMVIGQDLEFQFFDLGPRSLFNTNTANLHTVQYVRPRHIVVGDKNESDEETIGRCLQAMPFYPFRITPSAQLTALPTLMSSRRDLEHASTRGRIRCRCYLPQIRASSFADVQAFLHHTSVFDRESPIALSGIPLPKNCNLPSLTEKMSAVASEIVLRKGMLLPCQVGNPSEESFGVCHLTKNLGASRFECQIILDRPIAVGPGTQLNRKVTYRGLRGEPDRNFVSIVAIVEEILPDLVPSIY